MKMPKIKAYISVFGELFNPCDLSTALGIECTDQWLKGDKIANKSITRKESNWEYSSGFVESYHLDEVLTKLFEPFVDKTSIIKQFSIENSLVVKVFVVIEMHSEQTPSILLNLASVEFLQSLNAEFECDLYVIDGIG